ncbi:MAG: endopeptidase La [Deferribacteres bacterium]|nr:endopeptidase La [Deferribacteres bacterium]
MFGKDVTEELYPVIPLRDLVVFPHSIVPLFVGREKSVNATEYALRTNKKIFLVTQVDPEIENPTKDDVFSVGVVGSILQSVKLPDGTIKMLVEGLHRARLIDFIEDADFIKARILPLIPVSETTEEMEALKRLVLESFKQYAELGQKVPQEILSTLEQIEDPDRFCDTIASHLSIKTVEKQKVLSTLDVAERLKKVYAILQSEIEILQVEKKIKEEVRKQIEKNQKEYYLNEQLKAIQKELGRGEFDEIEEYREKIKKAGMPKEVRKKAEAELKKLELMPPTSAEATVVRNYLDWLVNLPWKKRTRDRLDINKAKEILDEDHYGLKEVKERILEYLAVRKRTRSNRGPILCLVGPPGVGKTSLGKSIAKAMGRKFVRVSLGGVRDEAEIRGHRRTYVGALPGRIIQMMRRAGTKNPVMVLDEIDKLGSDFRGDPSSALLEVLDPEQNSHFSDHYLGVDFDLSEVFFIATANVVHTIPRPLLDRMEVIRIPGYTEVEKLHIARDYLLPKQFKAHGLKKEEVVIPDEVILKIIREYTKEAGVRNLEREIAKLCRRVVKRITTGELTPPVVFDERLLEEILGVPKFKHQERLLEPTVGVVQGLAWTENGGELLLTEAMVVEGKGNLILTGQLGDVMQESAKAALTYVRSRREELGIPKDFYKKFDIHVHVPEGAIPKDGPSAGITIATAIASALSGFPVRCDIAMTGEITLRGKVLPIGGLKEKLLAAKRAGINKVLIPKDNEKDLKEVEEEIKEGLEITLVEDMDQVLKISLIGWQPGEKNIPLPKIYKHIPQDERRVPLS